MDTEQQNTETATSAATTKRAVRQVRALIIGPKEVEVAKADITGGKPGVPQNEEEDLWSTGDGSPNLIAPPFDMLTLSMLPEHSSELGQCVEAMEVNIEAFGWRQVSRLNLEDKDLPEELKKAAVSEATLLANFFEYATGDDSFVAFRRKMRKDIEVTGTGYFEVIRSSSGMPQQFVHMPSYRMRMGESTRKHIKVQRKILELQEDGSVEIKEVEEWRRFRPCAQARRNGGHRWFKQFLDPRIMDSTTGISYASVEDATAAGVKEEDYANEVVVMRLYSTRTPYGLPRYIGNLLSILGARKAEEINYITFTNNNIPSMAVVVSNGILTEGTIARIQEFVQTQIQGSDNMSKFLVIEGETDADEGEDAGQVRIEIKPLTREQHTDAMFQNYSGNNEDRIRRAFRLPPAFVGRAEEYTHATAHVSRVLADEQVFAPERDEFDRWVNRMLYPDMGIRLHKFKSNSPNTTDNEQLVKILAGAEKTGGMTPRIARRILEDVLGWQGLSDKFPEEFQPDTPFSLVMAEAVKNKADVTEPGQQVTALKRLADFGITPDTTLGEGTVLIRKALEDDWVAEVFNA